MQREFTVGIEEEFQLVDPESRDLRSQVTEVLTSGSEELGEQLKKEMFQSMVEVGTVICSDVNEARAEVIRLRGAVHRLAQEAGVQFAAAGTHPFAQWQDQDITNDERYLTLAENMQDVVRAIAVFGLHVHIGISDRDRAIEIMNEARYFMPHILALSTNSPFWEGRETGLKSTRSVVWGRLPRTGIPDTFASWEEYSQYVDMLLKTNSIDEPKKIWYDIRPHPKFNTLEFRVCDMPTWADETIALAALFQAVVAKLARLRDKNLGFRVYKRSLIAENRWRAIRYGLDGQLIDFGRTAEVPMRELAVELLEFVDDVVDDLGSREALKTITEILEQGTGADRQLEIFHRNESLTEVVDYVVHETMRGVTIPVGA